MQPSADQPTSTLTGPDIDIHPGLVLPLPDDAAAAAARDRLSTVDIGVSAPTIAALGMLAEAVVFVAAVQGTPYPRPLLSTRVVLLTGSHAGGVVAGPTPDPRNAAPLQHLAINAGAGIVTLEWQPAAAAIELEDAITPEQMDASLRAGWSEADRAADEGIELLVLAGSGAGASVAAAAVVAAITGAEPTMLLSRVVTPAGYYDDNAWMTRCLALRDALHRVRDRDGDPRTVLAALGGADLAAATGLILGAAARRTPIMIDGPVGAAAALLANDFSPQSRSWVVLADTGRQPAVRLAADSLQLRPWLDLCLDMGEGATSLAALPLLQTALTLAGAGEEVEPKPPSRFDSTGNQVFVGVAHAADQAEEEAFTGSTLETAPVLYASAYAAGEPAAATPTTAGEPGAATRAAGEPAAVTPSAAAESVAATPTAAGEPAAPALETPPTAPPRPGTPTAERPAKAPETAVPAKAAAARTGEKPPEPPAKAAAKPAKPAETGKPRPEARPAPTTAAKSEVKAPTRTATKAPAKAGGKTALTGRTGSAKMVPPKTTADASAAEDSGAMSAVKDNGVAPAAAPSTTELATSPPAKATPATSPPPKAAPAATPAPKAIPATSPPPKAAPAATPAPKSIPATSPPSKAAPAATPAPKATPTASPPPKAAPAATPAPKATPATSPPPEAAPAGTPAPKATPATSPPPKAAPAGTPAPKATPATSPPPKATPATTPAPKPTPAAGPPAQKSTPAAAATPAPAPRTTAPPGVSDKEAASTTGAVNGAIPAADHSSDKTGDDSDKTGDDEPTAAVGAGPRPRKRP